MQNNAVSTVAVVPVKELANVKRRLSGILDNSQRQLLFQAMVSDVLVALRDCPGIDETWVVTDDPSVAELARRFDALVKPEPAEKGLISAVAWAGRHMAELGVARLLFLPGDVPLVTVNELNVMLETQPGDVAEFVISPARDLGGSNCVSCMPPDCMEFGFGIDSFRRHLRNARKLGVHCRVIKLPGIGLDVDTPDDLQLLINELKASNIGSYTHRYLDDSGIN